MTIAIKSKPPRIWQGHKSKPSDKSILRLIAKAKGKGK